MIELCLPHKIVINYDVRKLCYRPYPNHPKGCPNYGKRPMCPPQCPKIDDVLDMSRFIYVVWVSFDFAAHREKMKAKHPEWSQRQIDCCLYWQGGVRKKLRAEIARALSCFEDKTKYAAYDCPEALGVNVTATMKNLDIELEWPPETIVYKVAIIGTKKNFPAEGLK